METWKVPEMRPCFRPISKTLWHVVINDYDRLSCYYEFNFDPNYELKFDPVVHFNHFARNNYALGNVVLRKICLFRYLKHTR